MEGIEQTIVSQIQNRHRFGETRLFPYTGHGRERERKGNRERGRELTCLEQKDARRRKKSGMNVAIT
jgi:hypothetical protein